MSIGQSLLQAAMVNSRRRHGESWSRRQFLCWTEVPEPDTDRFHVEYLADNDRRSVMDAAACSVRSKFHSQPEQQSSSNHRSTSAPAQTR